MTRIFTGGCACGAIRYEIAAEPIGMNDCQCRDCQRDSGAGHASYLTFARAGTRVRGDATRWSTTGEQGTVKSRAFCPTCGSPVYMTFPAMPDLFVVRAASLDDPGLYAPQMVLWTASAQPWDRVDPNLPTFDKMPPG